MKLKNILIVVKDIEKSKRFYHDLFGLDMVLDNNGNIDRKKLGKIVFGNSKKLRKLESINYPYIEDKIYKLINSTDKDVIIEAALIMRSEIYKMCDSLIYVNSKTSDIIKRMRKSRNISEKEARKILKMQMKLYKWFLLIRWLLKQIVHILLQSHIEVLATILEMLNILQKRLQM